MLAREGGLSEVFESGRRPDGERAASRRSQTIECLADRRLDVRGQRLLREPSPQLRALVPQPLGVVVIKLRQLRV